MTLDMPWGGSLLGCILLTEDGLVLRVNPTVARWLEYSGEELTGRSVHVLLGPGGQFFWQSQILPMLKLKGLLEEVYLRMRLKSGASVPVLANLGYVSIDGMNSIELSFFRITQRGQLEDELLQSKKLAEQASDAKTKFLAMMSHELRTPLQLISLNNQLLLEEALGSLTADQIETINSSQEATGSVVVLIDDILNYARMQGGPVQVALEDISVDHALSRAETSIRHRMEDSGLTFRKKCEPTQMMIRADPNRLQQILVNLLNNAIKFTPRGGSVTLKGQQVENETVIAVEDTGCGIPPDQLQRVFEPFVQLRSTIESNDKPGVGLGLAICRDLATAMNGRMDVQSVLGKGSAFSIALPLVLTQNTV
jgi:signal transduction histidine kinase